MISVCDYLVCFSIFYQFDRPMYSNNTSYFSISKKLIAFCRATVSPEEQGPKPEPNEFLDDDINYLSMSQYQDNILATKYFEKPFWKYSPTNMSFETVRFRNRPPSRPWEDEMKKWLSVTRTAVYYYIHSNPVIENMVMDDEMRFRILKDRWIRTENKDKFLFRRIFATSRMLHIHDSLKLHTPSYYLAIEYFDRIIIKYPQVSYKYMMNLAVVCLYAACQVLGDYRVDLNDMCLYIKAYCTQEYIDDCRGKLHRLVKKPSFLTALQVSECFFLQMHALEREKFEKDILATMRILSIHPYFVKYSYTILIASVFIITLGPSRGLFVTKIMPQALYDCCCDINPFSSILRYPYRKLNITQFNVLLLLCSVVRQESYSFRFNYNKIQDCFNMELLNLLKLWLEIRC